MSKSGGSKADTAVKLVLIFFISLLSFTVGTLVGGQFEKSKSHQMTLETEGGAGHAAEAEEAGDVAAAPISDEDVEGLEDFVTNGSGGGRKIASADEHAAPAAHGAAAAHGESAHEEEAAPAAKPSEGYTHASQIRPAAEGRETASAHAAPAAPVTGHEAAAKMAPQVAKATRAAAAANHETNAAVDSAAQRLAHDQAPAADMKKPRAPSAALPMVANSVIAKYTVQVASYGSETEAKTYATKLQEKGYDSFYLPAQVNGKTWYRVSIGRFEDQASAAAQRKKIVETVPSAIVQKILK